MNSTRLVTSMHDLAEMIFKLYNHGRPIQIIPVAASKQFPRKTFLMLLAGTEFKLAQANSVVTDVFTALHKVSAFDVDILSAVQKKIGPDSDIIIAGHSLGGMAAQVLAQNLHRLSRRVIRIITFGSPTTTAPVSGIAYLRYAAMLDPVPRLFIPGVSGQPQTVVDNAGVGNTIGVPAMQGAAAGMAFGPQAAAAGALTAAAALMVRAHLSYPNSVALGSIGPFGSGSLERALVLDIAQGEMFAAPSVPQI